MTREQKIEALLRTLCDYLPDPKTASYGDVPGVAPSAWADCKHCQGVGHFGKAKRHCAPCNGSGVVRVDAYTGEPVGSEDRKIRAADPRRIDAELARLSRDEAIRRGRMLDDPFAWEARRIRYRQAGSYASVERALDSLRVNDPDLCTIVMRSLVYGISEITDASRPSLARGLAFIGQRMPPEVRVPRWVTEPPPPVEREWPRGGDRTKTSPQRAERNATIIDLARSGKRQADIAREVGVSTATVSRVLASVQIAGTAA